MVLANQNAKLTGPDQGFLVSSSYESPGNEVVAYIMLGKTAEYRHEYSSVILLVAIAIVPSF